MNKPNLEKEFVEIKGEIDPICYIECRKDGYSKEYCIRICKEEIKKEFSKDALKLLGKRIKDLRIGETGIDIVVEDGTVLELYCLPKNPEQECECTWGWVIDRENNI